MLNILFYPNNYLFLLTFIYTDIIVIIILLVLMYDDNTKFVDLIKS